MRIRTPTRAATLVMAMSHVLLDTTARRTAHTRALGVALALTLLAPHKAPGQPQTFLTVDGIMRGPSLVGHPPADLRWSGDGERLYFEWQARDDDETATWVVDRHGANLDRLTDEQRRTAPPVGGVPDRTHRRVLGVEHGDIVLIDTVARTRLDVTRTAASESQPRWARNETHATFVRDGGLYIVPLSGTEAGIVVQLVETGPAREEPKKTPSQQFLEEEEARLLEYVREQAERRTRDEARRDERALPKLDLTSRQSVVDMQLHPSGRHAWVLVEERAENARRANVPAYVTESAYTTPNEVRTKVGDAQPRRRLAVVDLESRQAKWVAFEAPGRPADAPHDERWSMVQVSDDGSYAMASLRGADNKDRWLVLVDPDTAATTVVDHLQDVAWVREMSTSGWLADNRHFWFLSERDGWMHLYTLDAASPATPARQLTSGVWEITSAAVAPDRSRFYITSTEAHAGERHLYTLPASGGARTRLTSTTGGHASEVSPDGRTIGLVSSTGNRPPDVYVMANEPDATMTRVTTSPSDEWTASSWIDPRLVTFTARDGAQVPARLYTPEMVGARRHPRRPAVVFVHGAGYLQNAHRYWSQYYREYMFHHLLAARGYVVLDVDYRGSAGYGRDWRTAIYRHMGGQDLDDIVDGAKYLAADHRVDPSRIGVYGGSYGGFITLMAMFTTPDVFAAGAALRPVTDWAHYNHQYTSNILNVPQEDAEAYRRSSPIHFADGLKGALLICHGLVDVNVHAQDSIRLAQKLIELRKENWELALYPVEGHGFTEETSWADEYKRILRLFEQHLKRP